MTGAPVPYDELVSFTSVHVAIAAPKFGAVNKLEDAHCLLGVPVQSGQSVSLTSVHVVIASPHSVLSGNLEKVVF